MDTASTESPALTTVPDVIKALGGLSAVARLTGRSYRNVWNWQKDGRFSARTYEKMRLALIERGLSAPPGLWGIEAADAETQP